MKEINYQNEIVTIENIQKLYKTGYITEIIFDADSKTIKISEKELEVVATDARKKIKIILDPVVDSIAEFGKKISEAFSDFAKSVVEIIKPISDFVFNLSKSMANKKISKKRFMKLLQAEGIQRNEINKIVKGNQEPYTYMRYYITMKKIQRNK